MRRATCLLYKSEMKAVLALALVPALFCSCHTAKDVAVTSFRVIDAPAAYLRRHIDPQDQTTTTTTTVASDNVTPGRPVDLRPERPVVTERRPQRDSRPADRQTASRSSRASRSASDEPSPRSSTAPAQRSGGHSPAEFPTARPVPGKPGYVFSPYDPNSGYVDVTGYASGSKAKDPYSQKVFIVP